MNYCRKLHRWLFGPSCRIYNACKMTGRDKAEQVHRAHFVCSVQAIHGIIPISPVLEEKVEPDNVKLVNHDKERLHGFWKRDKDIIRYECRGIVLDHGEMKSFGMEREYCLSRGVLWKPTFMLVPPGTPLSVAQFEDDMIFHSAEEMAKYIEKHIGSRWNYWKWRCRMLNRSLLRWLYDQLYQWIV